MADQAAGHAVKSVRKRVTSRNTIHTVTCECGVPFESISSEGMARSYHTAHRKLKGARHG